jgi:DivIVA domain-containing protein
MATVLLVLVVVLVVAALVYGIVSLLSGEDPGLEPVEPDGRAVPLANDRSLTESDLKAVRFDLAWRGYRMSQVDLVLRRTAYDLGYKDEMIAVLEAEVAALRDGRLDDADLLSQARTAAASPATTATPRPAPGGPEPVGADEALAFGPPGDDDPVVSLDAEPASGDRSPAGVAAPSDARTAEAGLAADGARTADAGVDAADARTADAGVDASDARTAPPDATDDGPAADDDAAGETGVRRRARA